SSSRSDDTVELRFFRHADLAIGACNSNEMLTIMIFLNIIMSPLIEIHLHLLDNCTGILTERKL
ncbi:4560_t:CDS:1, partial [Entrophospora sp. SA101]